MDLKSRVLQTLSDQAVERLYPIFSDWEKTAYDQGIRNKYTANALKGKLAEEYLEACRTLKEYFRVVKEEHFQAYADPALMEIGDFVNMALVIARHFTDESSPYDNGRIPLERMILSMHFRTPDFRMRPVFPYDSTREWDQKTLFVIWLREIEAINEKHRATFPEIKERRKHLLKKVE